jgi:fibronectin-binding autotransporter adhesin
LFSDGGIRDLLADYTYHGANKGGDSYTLTLTGLQPGTHYSLRLYYCPHFEDRSSRDNTLIFSGDGKPSQITINENEKGAHYVSYDYVAVGTEVSVRFEAKGDKDWLLYGVTNEVIAHE